MKHFLNVLLDSINVSICRYDRQRQVLKEIHNCQYITCMNPTAGSFSVNPRLQVTIATNAYPALV